MLFYPLSEGPRNDEETIYFQYLKQLLQNEVTSKHTIKAVLELVQSSNTSAQNNDLEKISVLLADIKEIQQAKDRSSPNTQATESNLSKLLQGIKQSTANIEALTNRIEVLSQHIPINEEAQAELAAIRVLDVTEDLLFNVEFLPSSN